MRELVNGKVSDADAFELALRESERDAQQQALRDRKAADDIQLAMQLSLQEGEASAAKRVKRSEPCGLEDLIAMGFNRENATLALRDADGDVGTAAAKLLSAAG